MGVLEGTNLSQVNLSNLDLCLLDAHTLSLFFSVSTRTLAQMYSHITKHFAAPALSAKIKLEKKISDTQRGRGDTVGASCTHAHTWSIQTRTLTNNLWPSGCTAGAVTLCSFLPPSSISQLSVWGLIERMEAGVGEELRGRKRTGD